MVEDRAFSPADAYRARDAVTLVFIEYQAEVARVVGRASPHLTPDNGRYLRARNFFTRGVRNLYPYVWPLVERCLVCVYGHQIGARYRGRG